MISNCWHFSAKRSISDIWLGSSQRLSSLSGHLQLYHKFAHVVVNESWHNKFPINNIIHLNHECNAEAKFQFISSLRHIFMTSSTCFCWKKYLGSLQNNWQWIILCKINHYKLRAYWSSRHYRVFSCAMNTCNKCMTLKKPRKTLCYEVEPFLVKKQHKPHLSFTNIFFESPRWQSHREKKFNAVGLLKNLFFLPPDINRLNAERKKCFLKRLFSLIRFYFLSFLILSQYTYGIFFVNLNYLNWIR